MNRRTPRIVGLLALLVVLLGGGALLVAQRLLEGRGQIIASRASDALGLEVAIGGGIQLSLLPQLQFEARDVTVANLPGRPAPHLAEIGLLEFEISYLGLLRGKLEIDALEIERITLWIENDPNAQIAAVTAAAPEPETEGRELRFSIGSVDLRQGLLHYQSGDREAPLSARLETLSLEARGIHDPFQFSARGEFEGRRFDLAGASAEPFGVAGGQGDPVSAACEALRDRVADAPAGTGDQGNSRVGHELILSVPCVPPKRPYP